MKFKMKKKGVGSVLGILFLICLICVLPHSRNAAQASEKIILTWDPPNPDYNVSGYIIYYWCRQDDKYEHWIDNGSETSCTLEGFEKNSTYYFTVTAYNQNGDESDFSNEVSITFSVNNELPGDFNDDQRVDGLDFSIFRNEWGLTGCDQPNETCLSDINGDGYVDGLDFAILRNNWGKAGPI
jgi:hypothetical protein